MVAHPDARRKDDLEQIARRAMQKYGFLPDFSAGTLRELETLKQVDREAELPLERIIANNWPSTWCTGWIYG
jgi:hypothetical protein